MNSVLLCVSRVPFCESRKRSCGVVETPASTSISIIDAQGERILLLSYFQFLLLHHARAFETFGEDKSRFMASGRDVNFSKHVSFSSNPIQRKRRQVDDFAPKYVQYVPRQTFVSRRFKSGCGFCCCILSILFIRIQDKSVHIGKHVG